MHARIEPSTQLRALAAAQAGVVSAEQVRALGMPEASRRRWLRDDHAQRPAPVLYHLDIGNPVLHFLYGLNPVAGLLDLYRGCLFPQIVDWVYVIEGTIVSVVLFTIGAVVFRRSIPRVLKEL